MSRRLWVQSAFLVLCFTGLSCRSKDPPSPSPGNGGGETITGRERIGWDQRASDTGELATFRYAIYVDGARSELADSTCATAVGPNGFSCSGRLPTMSPGTHILELATFIRSGGIVESAKSAPLRVNVVGMTTPTASAPPDPREPAPPQEPAAPPLAPGDVLTTSDGVQLVAERVVERLTDPVDAAVAADGRLFIAQRPGTVMLVADGTITSALALDAAPPGGLLSIALAPDFENTHHVFLTHTVEHGGALFFRTSRYREVQGRLVERIVLLPEVGASAGAAATLRFGPDAKLYAAFDDGGNGAAAGRLSDWRGKVLRLEADGRTPSDQPAASPVFWSGVHSPRGLAWQPGNGLLWIADDGKDGIERMRAIAGSGQPLRAAERAQFVLPPGTGTAALAFYRHAAVPQFQGDLFVAAREGGFILRMRLGAEGVVATERLLDHRIGPVTVITTARDGALYFCSSDALWRLRPR